MVQATDFPARAKVLADEIAAVAPHVVGLQEVEVWRSQTPSDFRPHPNATTVEYDFLALLLYVLAQRGKSYEAVATIQDADAEAPRDLEACHDTGTIPGFASYTSEDALLRAGQGFLFLTAGCDLEFLLGGARCGVAQLMG